MDFSFTKEQELFRSEVRRFAQKEFPPLVPIMEITSSP